MKQHNRLLLQSLAAQDTSIRTLQQDNSSLWQNIQYNMEAHQSLKDKVSSHEERLDNQEEKTEGQAQSIRSLRSIDDKGMEKLRQDMEVRLNGQKTKTEEQAKCILSLQSANKMLRQEMINSISILNTRPNAQQHQLLLQVNVADLMANGGVSKYSERKPVGAYK